MKQKSRKNILEHFGIDKPFFKTDELNGADIERFVNREKELKYLETSIDLKQNCAIIGETGIGKSSILLKLQKNISEYYYTNYRNFSLNSKTDKEIKEEIYRSVLESILIQILENDELLDSYDAKEISFEIERLNFTISIENFTKSETELTPEIEAGFSDMFFSSFLPIKLKAKLKGKLAKEKQKTIKQIYEKHTEFSLKDSISKIAEKLPSTIVFFIDEMDKVIGAVVKPENLANELVRIILLTSEIMTIDNLNFVFALQIELYDVFKKAANGEADEQILRYIPAFKKIDGFDIEFAESAISKSLEFANYEKGFQNLFEKGIIEIVLEKSKGNPRQFMRHFSELLKKAYFNKELKVSHNLTKDYFQM